MKRTIFFFVLLFVTPAGVRSQSNGGEKHRANSTLQSPRLVALQRRLRDRQAEEVNRFWLDVQRLGTPLIEPVTGDKVNVLVTFLWRASEDTKNVLLISPLTVGISDQQLMPLGKTDVWYKSFRLRKDVRIGYLLSPNDPLLSQGKMPDQAARVKRAENFKLDPFNRKRFKGFANEVSVVELPGASPQQWNTKRPGVRAGQLEAHQISSAVLNNERRIWVYTPPDYSLQTKPHRLLLLFDGEVYIDSVPTPIILDNLLANDLIPPMVAVFVGNVSFEARRRELPCYPPFFEFLIKELMPWVRKHYNVTVDASETVIGGSSYGGLASAYAALKYPETFGNVLSQSGSYWWKPSDDSAAEWLVKEYEAGPKLPVRFYMEVGLMESGPPGNDSLNMLLVNRHMRDVLLAKGNAVYYKEFNGGHQYLNWRGTLADGIVALAGTKRSGKSKMRRP